MGAVFLLCLAGFTIMDMECRRIPQAIERSERRTRNQSSNVSVCVLFNKSFEMVHYFCLPMLFYDCISHIYYINCIYIYIYVYILTYVSLILVKNTFLGLKTSQFFNSCYLIIIQVKLSFIVIPLHVGTYSGTRCCASQDHGAT